MMLKLVWYLVLCQTVLFCNAQPHTITEETKYIRDGENITLSCSGEINATVTWKFFQNGSSNGVGVANDAVSKNPAKYSATYNGKDGVYTFTVHSFLEISDAGQYSCLMSLNFSGKKEVIFTFIEQATADTEKSMPLEGIIGGVTGGVVVILIFIIVVVLLLTRRRIQSIKQRRKRCKRRKGHWLRA